MLIPTLHGVKKLACEMDGPGYLCDLELDVEQGGSRSKGAVKQRFVKGSDGWVVSKANGLARELRPQAATDGAQVVVRPRSFLAWMCAAASLPTVLVQENVAAGVGLSWLLGLALRWQWRYLAGGILWCALALMDRRWHALVAAAIVVVAWTQASPMVERDVTTEGGPQRFTLTLATANANLNLDTKDCARLDPVAFEETEPRSNLLSHQ